MVHQGGAESCEGPTSRDEPCSLPAALRWAKNQSGIPVRLELEPGIYVEPIQLNESMKASELVLSCVAEECVLESPSHVSAGTIVFEGLTWRGLTQAAVVVSNGSLEMRRCTLEHQHGDGALHVFGGDVIFQDGIMANNSASDMDYGGAVTSSGGQLAVHGSNVTDNKAVNGGAFLLMEDARVHLTSTRVANNRASERGGAFEVSGGALVLSDGSLLEDNEAGGTDKGHSIAVEAGAVSYALPAPAGRWVFAAGSAATLSPGDRIDADYPFACAPGVFGKEDDLNGQKSPLCSGPCPAGFRCPGGTVDPQSCDTHGTYCPIGSPMETPCPPGKTSYVGGLTSVDECVTCPAGTFCSFGRLSVCGRGTYSSVAGADDQGTCQYCPLASDTTDEGRTSLSDCICDVGHFASRSNGTLKCETCPVGTNCSSAGSSLSELKLLEGYWRVSSNSSDVRRCPGALRGSPCIGGINHGEREGPCRDWLQGPYCSLCNVTDASRYYDSNDQECKACGDTVLMVAVASLVVVATIIIVIAWVRLRVHRRFRCIARPVTWLSRLLSQRAKFKQLLGFYQVVTRIGEIYAVPIPEEVARLLVYFEVFNINLAGLLPMQCLGFGSYQVTLAATLITPLVLAAVVCVVCLGHSCAQAGPRMLRLQRGMLLSLRWLLSLTFLILPMVSSAAFQAFACETFDDGTLRLRADYSIACGSDAHNQSERLAWLGIACYPLGVLLVYAVLLAAVRPAVAAEKPTPLSRAMEFLVHDTKPAYLWWELAEAWKKLFLVGFAALILPESVEQLVISLLFSLLFMLLTSVANPFRSNLDNVFAIACSFALVAVFFFSIILKQAVLSEEVDDVLTDRMRRIYDFNPVLVIFGMSASVLSGLVGAAVIGVMQLISAARQPIIRVVRTGLPPVMSFAGKGLRWHLFVSHIWSSAQDQAATIKRQLQLLVPTASIFLDVDDLEDIGQLEEYVAATQCVLIVLSRNYFFSINCKREVEATVAGSKPLVLVHETDEKKGGVPIEQLRSECGEATRSYVFGSEGALRTVIPWHRVASFQLVSLKLIVQGMLGASPEYATSAVVPELFVSNEHPRRRLAFRTPVRVFASPSNPGAKTVAGMLRAGMRGQIAVSTAPAALPRTRRRQSLFRLGDVLRQGSTRSIVNADAATTDVTHMLLYLNARTFEGDAGELLADELRCARTFGLPIVMVHENDSSWHACPFDRFFEVTPQDLITDGLFNDIAIAWFPGAYRSTSVALVAIRLGAGTPRYLKRRGHRNTFMTASTAAAAEAAAATPAAATSACGEPSLPINDGAEPTPPLQVSRPPAARPANQAVSHNGSNRLRTPRFLPRPSSHSLPIGPAAHETAENTMAAVAAVAPTDAAAAALPQQHATVTAGKHRASLEAKIYGSMRDLLAPELSADEVKRMSKARRKMSLTGDDHCFADATGTKDRPGRETTRSKASSSSSAGSSAAGGAPSAAWQPHPQAPKRRGGMEQVRV